MKCEILGCDDKAYKSSGLCHRHYKQLYVYGGINMCRNANCKMPAASHNHYCKDHLPGKVVSSKAKRICLKCDKPFKSTGKFNRLCNSCNNSNARIVSNESWLRAGFVY